MMAAFYAVQCELCFRFYNVVVVASALSYSIGTLITASIFAHHHEEMLLNDQSRNLRETVRMTNIRSALSRHFIRDMRNPGFVSNSGLPEERSWPYACACSLTSEPTLGPNPIQPGAQTKQSVLDF